MSFWKFLIFSCCFISSMPLLADDITEFILPNALKVVVKPDQRSPIVVFQIWYKVGSANEQKGHTGVSHLLEHLMYRSRSNPSLDDVHQKMSSIGTKGNAYTSRDHTYYYHILGQQHLELAFAVEAERMKHLDIDKNDFNIEKNVIREERFERLNRDPYLKASNALYKNAFKDDSYQFPVIGREEDENALTLEQAKAWHRNYYTPDNATIVVVGDIKPAKVFSLSKKYFSPIIKKKQISDHSLLPDEDRVSDTRFVMPEHTKVGMIFLAFRVPSIKAAVPAWQAYALDVLAGWFDSGTHSRLTRALVRDKKVAHEVFIQYSPMNRKKSLFIIEVTPAQGISLEQLELAIIDEIQQIRKELISEETLQKVKNQMVANEIFERDSMFIQAKIIGQAESVDIHWSEDAQYIKRIKAVTAKQVNDVLRQYIDLKKKFVVIQNSH